MYKNALWTCKVVVLRNKPIVFLTSWLSSPSSLLKLPIVLVSRVQKRILLGTTITSNGKGHSVRPTETTRPVKEDHLQNWSRIFWSDKTEMIRSVWCTNRNFRNFWVEWKAPQVILTVKPECTIYVSFCFPLLLLFSRLSTVFFIDSETNLWTSSNFRDVLNFLREKLRSGAARCKRL